MHPLHLSVLILLITACALRAGSPAPSTTDSPADKSIYTLFNPTPDKLLRDFAPDRPGFTNGPRTVDAGHFQIETGLFEYGHDLHNPDFAPIRAETFVLGDSEFRIGLLNWMEFDLLIPFYTSERDKDLVLGHTQRSSGIGDLTLGFKMNFWGDDHTDSTAGGLSLQLKAPTASHNVGNGEVEGAAVLLFDLPLPLAFDLSVNTGLGIDANNSGSGHHAEFINSAALSHGIIGPVSAFVEIYTSFDPNHTSLWQGSADFGFTWQLHANLQLDAGMNLGISRAADDLRRRLSGCRGGF